MAGKIFQGVVNQLKDTLDRNFGVLDDRGFIIASSNLVAIGTRIDDFSRLDFKSMDTVECIGGRSFRPLGSGISGYDYVTYVDGDDDVSKALCSVLNVAFIESKQGYDEKHNKASFIKNIISDNILPGDVYVRAKELHFVTDDPRIVILAKLENNPEAVAGECIARLFPDRQNDFVININEEDIVIVKKLSTDENIDEAFEAAEMVQKRLKEELGLSCKIGISTVANHLRELADRYKESQVAIEVGSIFESDKSIVSYASLGLGRIIYQLPTTLCEMFLNEVFKKNTIDSLDEDTLDTINRFFENNLNVSETSRKLYVHRNTLVYRLEKIKKLTGLDLREFDHAIVFKVAMMVKMYLDSLYNIPGNSTNLKF